MAGALVAQTRGAFVNEFVPLPSGVGTEAELTNKVPASPWELAVTTSATPSLARKERLRPWGRWPPLPLRSPEAEAVRVELVGGSEASEPVCMPEPVPDRSRVPMLPNPPVRGGPAFARRKRLDSTRRLAIGSKRGLTSRTGLARTMACFN